MNYVCIALLALSLVTLGCDRTTATAADKTGDKTTAEPERSPRCQTDDSGCFGRARREIGRDGKR